MFRMVIHNVNFPRSSNHKKERKHIPLNRVLDKTDFLTSSDDDDEGDRCEPDIPASRLTAIDDEAIAVDPSARLLSALSEQPREKSPDNRP